MKRDIAFALLPIIGGLVTALFLTWYERRRTKPLSFRTQSGRPFSDATLTLARRIERDYADLNLFDDIRVVE